MRPSTVVPRLVCAMALLLSAACGGDDDPGSVSAPRSTQRAGGPITEFEIQIRELEGSGVRGEATMETVGQGGEASLLVVELSDAPEGPLVLHTHSGPCVVKSTQPTHVLEPVVDGRSESNISAAVQGLTHGNFNIAVHADDDEGSEHIACGQISGPPSDE